MRGQIFSTGVLSFFLTIVLMGLVSGRDPFLATYNGSMYFINRNQYHLFLPDRFEQGVLALGLDPNDVHNVTKSSFDQLKPGEDVPVFRISNYNTPDDLMANLLAANKFLQGRLLQNLQVIEKYINPSLLPFRGRMLMGTCLTWAYGADMNEGKGIEDRLQFRWWRRPISGIPASEQIDQGSYLGLDDHISDISNVTIGGQDPRLMPIDDDGFYAVFTNRYTDVHGARVGFAEFRVDQQTNSFQVRRVINEIIYPNDNENQKNWMPFYYNPPSSTSGKSSTPPNLYFVERINPLQVVMVNISDSIENPLLRQRIPHYLVSQAPRAYHRYRFGELRGSTNAIDIGDRYLAIFHSVHRHPSSTYITYWIGAITFSKHPPFRLLSITSEPLMDEVLYTVAWHPLYRNRKLDYVLFPTALRLIDQDTLLFSFGWQDINGCSGTINLKRLLAVMDPVIYCDNPTTSNIHSRKKYCNG